MQSLEHIYSLFLKSRKLSTDSRQKCDGAIFGALQGENFNGNKFACQALENGCSYAIIDDKKYKKDERYLLVDNVLSALQDLAKYHRSQLKIPVICITGTNGKTTTKELINVVLRSSYEVSSTKGNLNNHIGVPLTILDIPDSTEIAVIEIGANHIGEIDFLCQIAQPNFGLITNIGKAHLEGFGSVDGVKEAKGELFAFLKKNGGKVFVNSNNEILMEMSNALDSIYYGQNDEGKCQGKIISETPFLSIEGLLDNSGKFIINSNLTGAYNFENVLAAICIGHYFNIGAAFIKEAIEAYIPDNNRSQVIVSGNNTIILDAYNANPMNMREMVSSFSNDPAEQKMVILGDMLELGAYSEKEHIALLNQVKACGFSQVILVGEQFGKVKGLLESKHFNTALEAGLWLEENPPKGMKILLKASRGIGLEVLLENLK